MATSELNSTPSGTGFLSFNSLPPRLHITAEPDKEEDFDQTIMQHWRDEGFDVTYLPFGGGGKAYVEKLKRLGDDLELGETFGLIAYGDAATLTLDVATKPWRHLCALVCYYPTVLNHPHANYPSQLNLTVHLATSQGFSPKFKYFAYEGVEPGFAEHDCSEFDAVSAGLAWSRSIASVRRGFKKDNADANEEMWEKHQLTHRYRDASAAVATLTDDAEVTYLSSLTGARGQRALYRFYKDFFMPGQPSSLKTRVLSRTVGVDRVVDEMLVSFRHDTEIPWMLPNVPPTNKNVEIPIVSIVALRGGKLAHEHVYWDQASVLVQIGLLDPNLVPGHMKKSGLKRLPVVGNEAARKLLTPEAVESNKLLPKWKAGESQQRSIPVRGGRKLPNGDTGKTNGVNGTTDVDSTNRKASAH